MPRYLLMSSGRKWPRLLEQKMTDIRTAYPFHEFAIVKCQVGYHCHGSPDAKVVNAIEIRRRQDSI